MQENNNDILGYYLEEEQLWEANSFSKYCGTGEPTLEYDPVYSEFAKVNITLGMDADHALLTIAPYFARHKGIFTLNL